MIITKHAYNKLVEALTTQLPIKSKFNIRGASFFEFLRACMQHNHQVGAAAWQARNNEVAFPNQNVYACSLHTDCKPPLPLFANMILHSIR